MLGLVGAGLAAYNAYQGHKNEQDARDAAAGLKKAANAPYESSSIQQYLPPELRMAQTGPILQSGMSGIGNLIRNPGVLSGSVGAGIQPQVGLESQGIAQQFRNQGLEQAGAAGTANLPSGVKALLQAALGMGQEGAQRAARIRGLGATDKTKRADLQQTYKLLDTILQFISSGRGQTIPGIQAAAEQRSEAGLRGSAANTAMIGSLLQAMGRG